MMDGERMMSRRIIGLVLLGSLICPAAASAAESGGGADAVFLDVQETYTLEEDGSMVYRHEHRLRYLTPYAFSRVLGEDFIVFNPAYQELEILRAVTTMADGREIACTDNAKNEVLPGFCRDAPPYMHLREMVVTHLGLERNAVVHLIYEIRSKPGLDRIS